MPKCKKTNELLRLSALLEHGNIELRCFEKDKVWSGVFNSISSMVKSIKFSMNKGMDIYNTLNPTVREATNDIQRYRRATRDHDIKKRTWLPFDIDVKDKDSEFGATDRQIEAAQKLADAVIIFMEERGWPDPVIGFSGNGWHLNYRIDLGNTDENKKKLSMIYKQLSLRLSNEYAVFDRVVFNASRILRTYGTVNTKGGRRSFVLTHDCEVVTEEMINNLYLELKPPAKKRHWVKPEQSTKGRYVKNLDIVRSFQIAGLYLSETPEPGKHFVTCPWAGSHSSTGPTDTVIWEGEWPVFHCSHDSCVDHKIKDVVSVLGL